MTQIIAHRGYSSHFPENTMMAFKEAAKHPILGIELDVHLTKDHQVVIIHDEQIDRTSNGTGWVKDMTLSELRQFNYYANFPHFQESHKELIQIPTLDEFLSWFKSTSLIVNIELKTNIIRYPGLNRAILQLLAQHTLHDRVIISSFNHHSLLEFKQEAQDLSIRYGFLTQCGLLEPGKYCQQYSIDCYHPVYISLKEEDIKDCQNHGIAINTYTVNEADHMQMMKQAGIDSIITNYVERAIEVIS